MNILVVSEGRHELGTESSEGALVILVKRLMQRRAKFCREKVSSPKVHVHLRPGQGAGYLKRELAWIRYDQHEKFDGLVFVIDQNGDVQRGKQLNEAQENIIFALPRAMGVAIRTFDAWMLADEQALTRVLGMTIPRQMNPEKIPEPKRKCRNLIEDSGYADSQTRMYENIATILVIETLQERCPVGFAPLSNRVCKLLN